jgi:hypothetical protein
MIRTAGAPGWMNRSSVSLSAACRHACTSMRMAQAVTKCGGGHVHDDGFRAGCGRGGNPHTDGDSMKSFLCGNNTILIGVRLAGRAA